MSAEDIISSILTEILDNLISGKEENVHEVSVNSEDFYEYPAEVPNASGDQTKVIVSESKVQSEKRDHEVPSQGDRVREDCPTEETSLYEESNLLKKPILQDENLKEGIQEHKNPANYDVLPPITIPAFRNGPAPKVGLSRNAKLKPLHKRRRMN